MAHGYYNGHYYELRKYDTAKNWTTFRDESANLGGHLATITCSEENNFLYNMAKNYVIIYPYVVAIGATDEEKEGVWKWITGEIWSYTNWAPGEPNNLSGNEDYGQMCFGQHNGDWNDSDNSYANCWYYFFVEYDNSNLCTANLSIFSISSSSGSYNAIQPVNISYGSTPCATQVQFDISYNSSYLSLSGVETGSASSSAGKSCSYNILGSGSARIVCAGNNQNTIGSGELVRIKWNISSNAPQGQSTTVGCSNAIGSDSSGNTFNMNCSSGTITFSSGNCCDLNNDGSVNVGDLQTLVNVILGKQSCPK